MCCCTSDTGGVVPGTDTKQVFRYVATGAEANPFTVGAAQGFDPRANANYNVQITGGGPQANAMLAARALVSTFTTTTFDVETSAPLSANDVLMFTVEDLT